MMKEVITALRIKGQSQFIQQELAKKLVAFSKRLTLILGMQLVEMCISNNYIAKIWLIGSDNIGQAT